MRFVYFLFYLLVLALAYILTQSDDPFVVTSGCVLALADLVLIHTEK